MFHKKHWNVKQLPPNYLQKTAPFNWYQLQSYCKWPWLLQAIIKEKLLKPLNNTTFKIHNILLGHHCKKNNSLIVYTSTMLCVVHKNTLGIGTAPLYILRMTNLYACSSLTPQGTVSYKILTATIRVCAIAKWKRWRSLCWWCFLKIRVQTFFSVL